MSVSDSESAARIDFGVTEDFQQVGEFANIKPVNGEDRLHFRVLARMDCGEVQRAPRGVQSPVTHRPAPRPLLSPSAAALARSPAGPGNAASCLCAVAHTLLPD